jgi:hypothetical protein
VRLPRIRGGKKNKKSSKRKIHKYFCVFAHIPLPAFCRNLGLSCSWICKTLNFLYFFLPLLHSLALSTFFPLPISTQQIFAAAAVIALGLCAVAFVVSEPAHQDPQEDSISNLYSSYVSVFIEPKSCMCVS